MSAQDEKAARLSAALRANLARRKDQARARKAGPAPAAPAASEDPQHPGQEMPGTPVRAERALPDAKIVPDEEPG